MQKVFYCIRFETLFTDIVLHMFYFIYSTLLPHVETKLILRALHTEKKTEINIIKIN